MGGKTVGGGRFRLERPLPDRRKLWLALAGVLAVAAVVLGIALTTGGFGGNTPAANPQPPAVQPIARGANAQQQARNLSAWLRRYSR